LPQFFVRCEKTYRGNNRYELAQLPEGDARLPVYDALAAEYAAAIVAAHDAIALAQIPSEPGQPLTPKVFFLYFF
jgi:hypothetical protein